MPTYRVQVNFFSREVFELPGGIFDAGGVQLELERSSLSDAIYSAESPAKEILARELAPKVIENLKFYVVGLRDSDDRYDVPFYFRPEGESSFSVRADKLENLKKYWDQSTLFDTSTEEDSLKLSPVEQPSFAIEVLNGGRDYEVWLCGWHDHVKTIDEVRHMCWWLFTSLYRIGRETCDGREMLFWLEIYGEEGWKRYSQVYCKNPYQQELWSPERGNWERTYFQQSIYRVDESELCGLLLDADGNPFGSNLGEQRFVFEKSVIWEENWGFWDN